MESWAVFGTLRLAGVERATAQLAGFEVAGRTSSETLLGVSRTTALVVGGLGLLGTALAAKGVAAFASFDDAMTGSLAIMGDVSDTLQDDMAEGARNMARETIFSAEQAAESYFFLASAGLDAEQSLKALPIVAKFAQAGMFDMAQATDLLTDAQSALGLSSDNTAENIRNMTRVSDVLVKANTLANATVEQFSQALTNRAAPRLRVMNKEIEEGAAILAVFADQGIKGARAGTALDQTLRELSRRANENQEAFKDMNIEVFREGEMRNIADIIEDMENAFAGMSTQARQAALAQLGFTQRSLRGILALQGTSGELRELQAQLKDVAGITDEVSTKQLDSLIKQLNLLGSEFTDLFIAIGSGIAPSIEGFVRAFREGIRSARKDLGILTFEYSAFQKRLEEKPGPIGFFAGTDRDAAEALERAEASAKAELAMRERISEEFGTDFGGISAFDGNLAEGMERILGLQNRWNEAIVDAERPYRTIMQNTELTGQNLQRFLVVLDKVPEAAAPFIGSLGEAERIIGQVSNDVMTWPEFIEQSREKMEELNEAAENAPEALSFATLDEEGRAERVDELVGGSQDLLALTEARREAGEDLLGVDSQIESRIRDINGLLNVGSDILTSGQEASLLRIRTALKGMLEDINPFNAKLLEIEESSQKSLTLMEARRQAGASLVGMQGRLRSHVNAINTALEQRNRLSDTEEANLLRVKTRLKDALETLDPMNQKIQGIQERTDAVASSADAWDQLLGMNLITLEEIAPIEEEVRNLLENQADLTRQQKNDLRLILATIKEIKEESIQRQVTARQPIGREPAPVPAEPIPEEERKALEKEAFEAGRRIAEEANKGMSLEWEDFGEEMEIIGENLIHSLITGTFNLKDFLKQSIARLASSFILGPLTSFFSFGSPSKLMIGYGQDITLGLAEGISQESEKVRTAWMGVTRQITQPSLTMGRMGALSGPGMRATRRVERLEPSLSVKVDTSTLPAPTTPFEVTRDAQWQKILRSSIEIARQDGFE